MKKTSLMNKTLLISIGTMLTKGINLLMIPLFSRWLSTEDYGMFDLFVTYVSLLIPFISLSSADAFFRFSVDTDNEEEKKRYISSGLLIYCCNLIFIAVIMICIHFIFKWEMAIPFLALLVAEVAMNYLQGVLRALKKLNIYSFANVFATIGIMLGVFTLVYIFGFGLKGMVYGYAFGYAFGVVIMIASSKCWKYISINKASLGTCKELVSYSFPLIPNNICWWIINVSDRTIINVFLGPVSNGIYAIANKIPNFCASIFGVFNISWQETAVEVLDSEGRNRYYNSVYNSTISTMISLCGGLLSLNYFLFNYIFDMRYFDARLYCPLLITAVIFSSLTLYFGGLQISFKRPKENGITTIIGAVVNVSVHMLLVKSVGLYAAALSTIASNLVICILRYIRLKKEIPFSLGTDTKLYMLYYIYMFVSCYFIDKLWSACINLLIACIMFLLINRTFLATAVSKVKAIKH